MLLMSSFRPCKSSAPEARLLLPPNRLFFVVWLLIRRSSSQQTISRPHAQNDVIDRRRAPPSVEAGIRREAFAVATAAVNRRASVRTAGSSAAQWPTTATAPPTKNPDLGRTGTTERHRRLLPGSEGYSVGGRCDRKTSTRSRVTNSYRTSSSSRRSVVIARTSSGKLH